MTKLFENAIQSIRPDGDAQQSRIPSAYDMSMKDASELTKMAKEDPFNAITLAFLFGFVMGNRATITRKMKKL